ncbi:hypothetical protein C8R45DRAFT_1219874 [Mycena sanguinolenta]|nr:hypothetical protein C8R45DRAFT_1219874 [Mycena sanguinolenta]
MANLIRNAKSGDEWTENDLAAYNIHAVENLPGVHPSLDAFATTGDRIDAPDDDTYRLLHLFDFAHIPKIGQEAAVDLFVENLLNKLEYAAGRRVTMIGQALPIFICGLTLRAQTGVCIFDSNDMILLLVARSDNDLDPEPPVIAEAITAFQHNNSIREPKLHLPVLDQMVFPAITMSGTCPTFYKITVSAALNNAVKNGVFPVAATTVYRHIPRLPHRHNGGMKDLANRTILLRYLEIFKRFVG